MKKHQNKKDADFFAVVAKKKQTGKLKKKLNYEKIISDISYRALLSKKSDNFYQKILETIGRAMEASCAQISAVDPIAKELTTIHQWSVKGLPGRQANGRKILFEDFQNFKSAIEKKHLLNIKDTSFLRNPKERRFFSHFGVKALLCTPIKTASGVLNFLAVIDRSSKRIWTKQEIRLLKTVANIISQTIERTTLQENIIHSKNHYAQVIDSIQDAICVIDKNHLVASYNRSFAEKIGLPIKKIKGLPCDRVIPLFENNLFVDHCLAKNRKKIKYSGECLVEAVFKTGEAIQLLEATEKNEKKYFYQINVFPTKNRAGEVQFAVLSIRNVTKKMAAEEDYLRLSELQKKIIDNIPAVIVTYDKHGVVTSVNKYYYKIFSKRDYAGQNIFYDSEFNKIHNLPPLYKKLLDKGVSFSKENCLFKNDKLKTKIQYLNVVAVPLYDKNNQIEGGVTMYIPNTEAFIAKAKLVELNKSLGKKITLKTRQLLAANKELKEAVELKTKFMADASHELRTPLTIIRGNLEMMDEDIKRNRSQEALESLELVKREVDAIKNLLTDLMTLTGSSISQKNLLFEKIDIISVAKEVIESLKPLAREKSIILKFFGPKKLEMLANEAGLQKMFFNLINNGIKYGKKKGFVKIEIGLKNNQVTVVVEDNGIGMPKKDLPYIFERFYRVDKARSRAEGGTGLGLSICKWAVIGHQGKITVQSQLGKGSKFTIKLPIKSS